MADMKDRRVLITGGGSGIGLGCAEAVVKAGGRVVLAGRREDVLEQACSELGAAAAWASCDVGDDAQVRAAVDRAVKIMGGLDGAVNAAGQGAAGTVINSPVEDFEATLKTNLSGVYSSLRWEARAMKACGGGSIVNVSSIAAVLTHPWMTAYCVSKAAVNMLTRCAADDLGEYGVRVNAVMPGLVRTGLVEPITADETSTEEYLQLMPLRRVGEPTDVASLATFLLSGESSWITGQTVSVDGGHSLRKGPDLSPLIRQVLPVED
jgi:NAD(P)-dependent dehydrogenase (short-subunit alcohol dehydrogenase family)